MAHYNDLTGQKFGKLTVISKAENKSSLIRWNCICDCGSPKTVYAHLLKRGNTKSCGCIRGYEDKSLSVKNFLFYSYRKGAEKRNLSFTLKFEEFINLIQQNCFYCGIDSSNNLKIKNLEKVFIYNGIDRIDSNIGYEILNVVSCCRICNWAKADLTKKEFTDWIEKCHKNLIRKYLVTS